MIAALPAVADKLPASSRPSGDESTKRADAPRPSQLTAVETDDSSVVEISSQGASMAGAPASTAPSGAAPAPTAQAEASEFDEADANQDGTVNVLEQRAYDFMHPTLARYPGSPDEKAPSQKTVAAELKAYEAVARSGRNQ